MRRTKSLRTMAIVHGKSEFYLCTSIRSNLRMKKEIIARKKGANSIQITSLMNELGKQDFSTFKTFISRYPDIDFRGSKLLNFKIFLRRWRRLVSECS